MSNIKVKYDGEYPNACRGNLVIKVDGEEIYNKDYCCYSTGCVWFDSGWDAHVESGELIWKDASRFSTEIQEAVKEELDKVSVCCGGCV